jgi:hypothetical protein
MSIKRFLRWYFVVPIALIVLPLFLALLGEIVKLLWNALLPPLFGWPQITIWQGLALLVLCRMLFGGFGGGGGGGGGRHSKRMSPEERERFRQRMCERSGNRPAGGEAVD